MAKLIVAEVKRAIKDSGAVIETIAERCGESREAVFDFIEARPRLKQALAQEDERMTDVSEKMLIEAIEKGDSWAVKFRLSTKGKKRGYGSKSESEEAARPSSLEEIERVCREYGLPIPGAAKSGSGT